MRSTPSLLCLVLLLGCPSAPPAEEPASFPGDPERAGPATVEASDHLVGFEDVELEASLHWPQDGSPWDVDAPPAVVLMPGFSSSHTAWRDWAEHLASWGFAVASFTFSANSMSDEADHERDAREALAVLDWLGEQGADLESVAMSGHSKGGKISFFAAVLDERVDAVVAFDPVDSGGPPCFIDPDNCHNWSVAPGSYEGDAGMMDGLQIASLVFAAPASIANPEEHHASLFFDGAPSPALFALHPEALHAHWPGEDDVADVDQPMAVAWLARELLGIEGTEPWLQGEWLEALEASGDVEVQRK